MIKRRILYLFGFTLFLSLFLPSGQVKAHDPYSMTLEYDMSSETLSVTISHSSGDFSTHYIYEVTVIVGAVQVYSQSYTSQPSNTFTYNYYVSNGPLELLYYVINVTARSTQVGIITRIISVNRNQPSGSMPEIAGFGIIIGISTIILISTSILLIKRKLKK